MHQAQLRRQRSPRRRRSQPRTLDHEFRVEHDTPRQVHIQFAAGAGLPAKIGQLHDLLADLEILLRDPPALLGAGRGVERRLRAGGRGHGLPGDGQDRLFQVPLRGALANGDLPQVGDVLGDDWAALQIRQATPRRELNGERKRRIA